MTNITSQIQFYIDQYKRGDRQNAFSGLSEMPHDVLPELIAIFKKEHDKRTRVFLVEVIWQHRQQSLIPFLAEILHDPEPDVWKEALDGLVALASPHAVEALRSAKNRQFTREKDAHEFREWIDEAIEQTEKEVAYARYISSPTPYKFELTAKLYGKDIFVDDNFDFPAYEQYMSEVITQARNTYMVLWRNDPKFWLHLRISERDKTVDFAWHDTPEDYEKFLHSVFSATEDLIYDFWEQGAEFYFYRRNRNIEIENCDGEFKHNVEYTLMIPEQIFLKEMSKIQEYLKRFATICQKFPKMGQANLFYYHPKGK